MILSVLAACAGLAFGEWVFFVLLSRALPNYTANLARRGLLKSYLTNASSLLNAVVCTWHAGFCISTGAWEAPPVLVAHMLYDGARTTSWMYRFHHAFVLVLLYISEWNRRVAPWVLMTELSSVFFALGRIIGGHAKLPRTPAYMHRHEKRALRVCDAAFRVTFVLTRLIMLPFLCTRHPVLLPLVALNVVWAYRRN